MIKLKSLINESTERLLKDLDVGDKFSIIQIGAIRFPFEPWGEAYPEEYHEYVFTIVKKEKTYVNCTTDETDPDFESVDIRFRRYDGRFMKVHNIF